LDHHYHGIWVIGHVKALIVDKAMIDGTNIVGVTIGVVNVVFLVGE